MKIFWQTKQYGFVQGTARSASGDTFAFACEATAIGHYDEIAEALPAAASIEAIAEALRPPRTLRLTVDGAQEALSQLLGLRAVAAGGVQAAGLPESTPETGVAPMAETAMPHSRAKRKGR